MINVFLMPIIQILSKLFIQIFKRTIRFKSKVIEQFYNLNQAINYIKYNSEQRSKRVNTKAIKRKRL